MPQRKERKKHPLVHEFLTVKGNPRLCLYTEPLWSIPFNLFTPFLSVYMAALLLNDTQIGLVASITLFFRAIMALFSGAVTDKLGRKLTTFIFDTVSWSVPCLLWALSQNFWWFVIAAIFNGFMQIPDNSWTCLLVEDTKKDKIITIYTLFHTISQISVIFAPIAAILVHQLTIVPAMRIILIFSFLSMSTKFILLFRYCHETKVGKTRMHETADMSIWQIMRGYGQIFKRIFASRDMLLALMVAALIITVGMVSANFFGLYVTGPLGIPEYLLAYFPIIRSLVIALFLFFLQPKIEKLGLRRPMLVGIVISVASCILLIFSPVGSLILLFVYVLMDAVAFSLVVPSSDSITQMLIEPSERARIRGLMMVIVLGFGIPFGYLAGFLSDIDRRLPFLLIIGLFVAMFVIIAASKKRIDAMNKGKTSAA